MAEEILTQRRKVAGLAIQACLLVALAVAGLVLAWDKGQVPLRSAPAEIAATGNQIAPDLALYAEVIAAVRSGAAYYDAAGEKIPQYGFPISSPLNWRLPTYAWVLSRLPCPAWIVVTLATLSLLALGLSFAAINASDGPIYAAFTTLFLIGVVRWSIDGYASLAQEPWSATLIVISLAASSLSERDGRWRILAVGAGIAALLFRELALPYCAIAAGLAVFRRRWLESASWTAGIALFFAFYAWHIGQVKAQLGSSETAAAAAGIGQWLRMGGLDFVLLTTRMNGLLFSAPSWLLWFYVLAALLGLSQRDDHTSQVACLSALAYLVAFALLGRPENFYWGLLPAPFLAWGVTTAPLRVLKLVDLYRESSPSAEAVRAAWKIQ